MLSLTPIKNQSQGVVFLISSQELGPRHHHWGMLRYMSKHCHWCLLRNSLRHCFFLLIHLLTNCHWQILRKVPKHCQCLCDADQGIVVEAFWQTYQGIVVNACRDELLINKFLSIFIVSILTTFVFNIETGHIIIVETFWQTCQGIVVNVCREELLIKKFLSIFIVSIFTTFVLSLYKKGVKRLYFWLNTLSGCKKGTETAWFVMCRWHVKLQWRSCVQTRSLSSPLKGEMRWFIWFV